MSERKPTNLQILYDGFGREAIDGILGGETFEVDGVEFVCRYMPGSTAERFYLVKQAVHVDEYRALCERFRGARIMELGIAEGGSVALLSLWAEPEKFVAIDLESDRLEALDDFIAARGLQERVRPFYGVDQGDRARLAELVEEEFDGPLDWIVDDASHDHDLTRTSFEALFPHLRPGGLYIIEDWDSSVVMRDAVLEVLRNPEAPGHAEARESLQESLRSQTPKDAADQQVTPLARLALELTLACASLNDAVAEVRTNGAFIAVTRGEAPLPATGFSLGDIYDDHYGLLVPR